ncbi:DUF1360 domain-containing protein [Streptomyces sp. 549]|uniref:DUF1360 domain-containing protein n=1 Tax=Streptomyces sp. 549 TaxID=3049076 RepID=UPI0024C23139|nr:DUF1360 domain-containing protein [Streptomyces sp. 549]MDK1473602.1 DUF1360 domain-containing protein [Streptomyces sp. 549]
MDMWLLLIVMALATYRLTRLVVADTFPPVLWLRDRLVGGWRELTLPEMEKNPLPVLDDHDPAVDVARLGSVTMIDGRMHRYVNRQRWVPFWLAELLSCPWCAGGWVALAVTAGVWAVAGLAMPVLVWLAVWAVGALISAQEWA